MHRRRLLASILGVAVAACTKRTRHLHLGHTVETPPRHMMTSHVRVQRIEVHGNDPDAFILGLVETMKHSA